MRTHGASYLRVLSLISCLTFLLLCFPPLPHAADQSTPQSASKPKKAKSTATTKKSSKKKAKGKSSLAVVLVTEEDAQSSFDAFTVEWMDKLQRTEEFQRTERIKVIESAEGFLAEYMGYLPHRYVIVRKTSSKDTPYIGILTYYQQTMRCVGKTREEAVRGPFQQTGTSQVSEIFRFTKGRWHY
jgi:hypothetical protein